MKTATTAKSRQDKTDRKSKPKKESGDDLKSRAIRICGRLHDLYGDKGTALRYRDPFQLLIATILSAQCTDEQVNRATPALFKEFPSPQKMAGAKPERIEELIHSTGFFRQKAKSIMAVAKAIAEKFGGKVPESMEDLTSLPGVGRKTANCVRAEAFGKPGIVVDTHFRRLVQRMGLVEIDDPTKIEFRIAGLLPESQWSQFSNSLIWHGRRVCMARAPKCPECAVLPDCPFGQAAVRAVK